jgi:hypothetical protein
VNRSAEELRMRELIVPKLRETWPSARVIHELPTRYSTNRIDLAAVTASEIVAVEIKSSRDVADRLEAQLRAFAPLCTRLVIALAPKWVAPDAADGGVRTKAQEAIGRCYESHFSTWTVDAGAGTVKGGFDSWQRPNHPWPARMLHILHVAELQSIAAGHRILTDKRANHWTLVRLCADLLTGREAVAAVCHALRTRNAFAAGTDAPQHSPIEPAAGIA